ncbi:MAG: guanylate kinase [Candidatus Omnitrophica bacterium]|nr:guanylate kinase [Candidatus Omnitrophota bacterium]
MKKSENKSKTSNKELSSSGEGVLVIVSAPSGCGKTTLVERLLKRHPDWVRSISMTTRQPRMGEKNGEDYFFVTSKQFEEAQKNDELLESATVFDHAYGTPKNFVLDSLKKGHHVLMAIDVQGAKKAKKAMGKTARVLTLFVLPPSVKVLRERLEGRKTESPEEIQRRIEIAQDEIKEASFYDHTVVNQNLEETVHEIEDLIEKFQKG